LSNAHPVPSGHFASVPRESDRRSAHLAAPAGGALGVNLPWRSWSDINRPTCAGPRHDRAGGDRPALGEVFDFDDDVVVLLIHGGDRRPSPALVRVAAGAVDAAGADGDGRGVCTNLGNASGPEESGVVCRPHFDREAGTARWVRLVRE